MPDVEAILPAQKRSVSSTKGNPTSWIRDSDRAETMFTPWSAFCIIQKSMVEIRHHRVGPSPFSLAYPHDRNLFIVVDSFRASKTSFDVVFGLLKS